VRSLADTVLPASSPLRSLYDLGAAIGDYQLELPMHPVAYEMGPYDSWPVPDALVGALRRIPETIAAPVPLLATLVQTASNLKPSDGRGALKTIPFNES
jgi:hypothetical protein